MKKLLFGLPFLFATMQVQAQAMKTITGIRLYEHHSSTINNGSPFGSGANGKKCGFNFMENRYFSSIDSTKPATEWKGNEAQHIDMVEHKGPYGGPPGQPPFGFTSGASTIWGGTDIKGNGKTLYMEAPAGFNYDTTTNVATIQKAYKAASASVEVPIATKGKVYIACIRNTNRYIVMKITEVKNKTPQTTVDDVYFDFDYKWGDYVKPVEPNAVNDAATAMQLAIWPNPVKTDIHISLTAQGPRTTVNVYNNAGQLVATQLHTTTTNQRVNATVNMSALPAGAYYVTVTNGTNTATQVFVKE